VCRYGFGLVLGVGEGGGAGVCAGVGVSKRVYVVDDLVSIF
jgi:hypothetical protein